MRKGNLQQYENEKGKMKMTNIMTTTKKGSFEVLKERLENWIKQGKQEPVEQNGKAEWKEERLAEWKGEGIEYRERRIELDVKVKDIALLLGVSVSRIYR
jgi:hypothetical protein